MEFKVIFPECGHATRCRGVLAQSVPASPASQPMIDLHLLPHLCLAGLVAGRARWYFWPVQTSLYFKIHIPSALAAGRRAAAPGREQECVLGRNAGLSYPPASAQTTQHSTVQYSTVQHSTVTMGKWRLVKLLMCSAKYQRLTTEDYIRLGLCPPDQEASTDSGHYVKNDKMVSWSCSHCPHVSCISQPKIF